MGRHSRKGPAAPVADTGKREAERPGTGRRRRAEDEGPGPAPRTQGAPRPQQQNHPYGSPYGTSDPNPNPYENTYGNGYDTPGQGTPAHGTPLHGTPAHGTPVHGTPPHGTPRHRAAHRAGGPAAPGAPAYDTPMHGTPRFQGPYGSDASGDTARGAHPVHDERTATGPRPYIPGPRKDAGPGTGPLPVVGAAASGGGAATVTGTDTAAPAGRAPGRLGRTLTGIAAAAITTVLAVVVAGQVTDRDSGGSAPQAHGAADGAAERDPVDGQASRSDDRPDRAPATVPAKPAPPSYDQLMARQFPIDPKLTASGHFVAVPGFDKAPGHGRKIRYRVDVEEGLGLDGALFAQAVQKTLNDPRSWAGNGEMTFERISSGDPEFVVSLASPGTTGDWCRKSGLDTTVDNVSCDSASTQRVMINAFRWAQGSVTFGKQAMHAYRQMLINHEVGHRLGHGHVSCRTPGALAPVMQQQTKSLDIDGIKCRPNPWVHPGS
ncbi:DUF3152 domain-containing protein [Streptomyces sp. NPDC090025]|uniref:DUF3152 domain-containing protein n=1 Tax=Streptomyces sp. NPDC090025 TaxID=3365922 RepID=UPI003833A793